MLHRYISNIIVYLGAADTRTEGDNVSEDAVLTSVRGLEGRGHVIITDNYFTSPHLFMELKARSMWATGTVRKNRKGFPASLSGFPPNQLPKRGSLIVRMHRDRDLCAICWIDSKAVFLLTSACNPIDENAYAGRWVQRKREEFPTSPILLQYQRSMRGVDLVDQQRQEYSVQLHSHKWWHRLFLFILDSSLLNSYVLYAEDQRAIGMPSHSRALWHYELAMSLVQPVLQPNRVRGRHENLAPPGFHRSEGHPTARRPCCVCGVRTRRLCAGCGGRHMCDGHCYIRVHTQPAFRLAIFD